MYTVPVRSCVAILINPHKIRRKSWQRTPQSVKINTNFLEVLWN
jgi:hypothetical protein